MQALAGALGYGMFAVGALIQGYLLMPLLFVMAGCRRSRAEPRCQWLLGQSARLLHVYLRLVRVAEFLPSRVPKHLGIGRAPLLAPVIVVANHVTLVDTTALLSCYPWLTCVTHGKFGNNPVLWPLLYFCGHLVVGPRLDQQAQVVTRLLARLQAGQSVLLFPEATRSRDGKLGTLRRGAFELARRAQVPLLPVFISARPAFLTGEPWYQVGFGKRVLEVVPLAPVWPQEFMVQDKPSQWLMNHVSELLERHLASTNDHER